MNRLTLRAAAVALLSGYGCATDPRYQDGLLGALGDDDRRRCEAVVQVARERAGTRSLRDLTAEDWGVVTAYAFAPLLIVTFEMGRLNEADRTRAAEAALLACVESITGQEKACASTSCGR